MKEYLDQPEATEADGMSTEEQGMVLSASKREEVLCVQQDVVNTAPELSARDTAINAVLAGAYAKASSLTLSPEESKALMAEFPDEAVSKGAAGDDNLLYIGHGWIRERLLSVFGPCQWSLLTRSIKSEPYKTKKGEEAIRVYADCVMVVRGCYVGEAIGAASYFTNNAQQDYSTAAEAAQSEALRRISGKYLGIGLQVWKRQYCEAWKQRITVKTNADFEKREELEGAVKAAYSACDEPTRMKWSVWMKNLSLRTEQQLIDATAKLTAVTQPVTKEKK